MTQKRIIVYAISNDYERIRDIEKYLWENQQNTPFDDADVAISPDPKPGYKGLFYLNVTNPSEKLIKSMEPSYASIPTGKYQQFDAFTDNDMQEMIKMMVHTQKRDPREIAKTLGVTVSEVLVWGYHVIHV